MTEAGIQYIVQARSHSTSDVATIGPFPDDAAAWRARDLIEKAIAGREFTAPDATVSVHPIAAMTELAVMCTRLRVALGRKVLVEEQGERRGEAPPRRPSPAGAETGRSSTTNDAS